MAMLSPLKPLLCRHDYFWSERHHADRCRRCGKTRAGDGDLAGPAMPAPESISASPDLPAVGVTEALPFDPLPFRQAGADFLDIPHFPQPEPEPERALAPVPVRTPTPSAKVLKAQAKLRRENLMALLERLAEGRQPSREEAIDAVLAVIEDAHSADPVLFGSQAPSHFARLHEARAGLIF